MPLMGVIIENPALEQVGLPIVSLVQYEVNREINAAGSWACAFPASEQLAAQIKSRWRVSLVEHGRPGYLLYRGIILDHTYRINEDGTAIVALQGMSRLFALMSQSTHRGLEYAGPPGVYSIDGIALDLTGEEVTAPADADTRTPIVTYNDESKLAALLHACELARYNIRETFDQDGFELVSQDDVPDSGYRFVNVEAAGPELETAAANNMGLIAGAPTIGYSGKDLANRIIPLGVEWDGKQLELDASDRTLPYAIQTGTNPDLTSYYYLEDTPSVTENGLIEMQYVRSDVKNPSDDAGTRLASANVLYDLAAGELLKRKSEVVSFGCNIANGYNIDALPGSRVRVQFRGTVRLMNGRFTYKDLDQDFLVVKRRDVSTPSGVRDVSFTLAAPDVPLLNLDLPGAVPIPPPPGPVPDPPNNNDTPPGDTPGGDTPGDTPGDVPGETPPPDLGLDMPTDTGIAELAKKLADDTKGIGPYQSCCAGPTDVIDGSTPPPQNSPPVGPGTFTDAIPVAMSVYLTPQNILVVFMSQRLAYPVLGGTLNDLTVSEIGAFTVDNWNLSGDTVYFKSWLLVPSGPNPIWTQEVNTFGTPAMVGVKITVSGTVVGASASETHDSDNAYSAAPISASVTLPPTDDKTCILIHKSAVGDWTESGPSGAFFNSGASGGSTMTSAPNIPGQPAFLAVQASMITVTLP